MPRSSRSQFMNRPISVVSRQSGQGVHRMSPTTVGRRIPAAFASGLSIRALTGYRQPSPSLGAPWLSLSASPPPPCGMQLPVGATVVVWWVVVGGGGGGGAACVVVVGGGGGGGAACVVVVGAGVLLGAVGTAVAAALCGAG